MAENDENIHVKPLITEATWGFLVLRLWLGFRMLFAGADKFYAPVKDELGRIQEWTFAWSHWKTKAQEDVAAQVSQHAFLPLNPYEFLRKVCHRENPPEFLNFDPGIWFAYALPWLLLVFGLFLILGIMPRFSLAVTGFIFMFLSIGLMALGPGASPEIADLGVHVGLVAAALLMVRHSRFCTRF